jgi:hypothetical protein
MKKLILVIPAFLLTACVHAVGPKSWTGAPPVMGTLHNQGEPIPNAKIRLIHQLDHEAKPKPDAIIVETVSNENGQFSIGPVGKKSHSAYISFLGLGESIANWGIQFQIDGQWVIGWQSWKIIGYAPRDRVFADCDMARDSAEGQIEGTAFGTRGSGFCKLSLDLKGNSR